MGVGDFEALSIFGRNFLMRFSLNGWSSKFEFDDVQLMTIRIRNQDGGLKPEASMNK